MASAAPRRTESRKARSLGRQAAVVPTESAFILSLLGDVLLLPLWLGGLILGHRRARISDGLRPFLRLQEFATAARMTALLIAVNLLVFTIEACLRKSGFTDKALLEHFALRRVDLQNGHYRGLFLHVFAHASPGHLGGNLLALFVFGRVVERHLGPWRLLLAYGLSAALAAGVSLLAQLLSAASANTAMLGASGAVAGLVALGVLLEPFAITFEALFPMPLFLCGWLTMAADLLALWQGARDHIDHPAHFGGYLSIVVLYQTLDARQKQRTRAGLLINLLSAFGVFTLWRLLSM